MIIHKIDSSIFLGFSLGFILCNQSIRAITHSNFVGLFFLILLISFPLFCIKNYPKFSFKLPKSEALLLTSYLLVILYASFSLIETGWQNVIFIADLLSLLYIYLAARLLNLTAYKVILGCIFVIGFTHALMLILARAHIYSSGVNYLLLSLVIGLFTCFSLIALLKTRKLLHKLLLTLFFLIGWLALFSMQSRATFIFVVLFSIFMPVFIIEREKRIRVFGVLFISIFCLFIFFFQEIISLYEASKVFQRMDSLFNNFGEEQRFITYGLYFGKVYEFFPTGYGIGGTTDGIYSTTIEKYPHNFILEFFSEFGVFGLFFSGLFIARSLIVSLLKFNNSFIGLTVFSLYLFYLMNFSKSFSIYDSSMLFLAIGLVFNKNINNNVKQNTPITLNSEVSNKIIKLAG